MAEGVISRRSARVRLFMPYSLVIAVLVPRADPRLHIWPSAPRNRPTRDRCPAAGVSSGQQSGLDEGQRPDGEARKALNLLWISYTLYSGLLLLWDAEVLYRGWPAMPRKQLNVTLTPEQYEAVQEAAAEEGGEGVRLLPERHPDPGDA